MDLLPAPTSVFEQPGVHVLDATTVLTGRPEWVAVVRRLLGPGTGFDLPGGEGDRFLLRDDAALPAEAYRLEVTPQQVIISASSAAGINWATQTLRQLIGPAALLPAPTAERMEIPCASIADEPRFAWRGAHLDVARHFAPLPELFRFIDLIALHKYNVFHFHLTDDQGWRFASDRYPRLQEIASWRTETQRHEHPDGDGTPHGGFYTKNQLRSLVRYAADRGVTIVPELEFPGHVRGVLAAYPELGNHPERAQATATTFGVFDEVLSLDEQSLTFVFDLFEELLEVFPSPYVHVGGDECPRTEWLESPAAQARAAELGLAGPDLLQRWFTERLRDWLAERGRRLVGWDEINDEGPLEGAVAMAWRDSSYGIAAARAGIDVVMAPLTHTYLDYYPSADPGEPYGIGGLLPVEQVYAFEPLAGLPEDTHARVLGTQCQLWREYLPTAARTDYAMFPRACAHAEVAWSDPTDRSWEEFEPRLRTHLTRLDALGVNYRPLEGPRPWQQGGTGRDARPAAHHPVR